MRKVIIMSIDEEFKKARTPGAKDVRKRKRRVVHQWNKIEGSLQKITDFKRYTAMGPEYVREAKVKWDNGITEWHRHDELIDKETGKPLHKMHVNLDGTVD